MQTPTQQPQPQQLSKPWTVDLNFTTKEEYLAWRSEWKRRCHELSEAIRGFRLASRKRQSFYDRFAHQHDWKQSFYTDLDAWHRHQAEIKKIPEFGDLMDAEFNAHERMKKAVYPDGRPLYDALGVARSWATIMLAARKESKIKAGQQRQAALAMAKVEA